MGETFKLLSRTSNAANTLTILSPSYIKDAVSKSSLLEFNGMLRVGSIPDHNVSLNIYIWLKII